MHKLTINDFQIESYKERVHTGHWKVSFVGWEQLRDVLTHTEFDRLCDWVSGLESTIPYGVFPWDLNSYLLQNACFGSTSTEVRRQVNK